LGLCVFFLNIRQYYIGFEAMKQYFCGKMKNIGV